MSRRHEIARRLDALADIAGIMSAMKGLALMEVRILSDLIASQHLMVAGIEAAAAEFLAAHGEFASSPSPLRELWILVGSEQGFCGDFNESLLARMESLCQDKDAPPRWVVVGRRLASRIGERDCVEHAQAGATVADEVPAVLLRLTREVSRILARPELAGFGLSALYHCVGTGEIRLRPLLPLRDLPPPERALPYPAELNLAPEVFMRGLTGHYLYAALNQVLYGSLMTENQQREKHMDQALRRLDEDSARLKLSYNMRRQEEITEEIELILLSAGMLKEDASQHGPFPGPG